MKPQWYLGPGIAICKHFQPQKENAATQGYSLHAKRVFLSEYNNIETTHQCCGLLGASNSAAIPGLGISAAGVDHPYGLFSPIDILILLSS